MSELAPAWIAVDWGTTNLRAWGLDADDRVAAEAASGRGMGALAPDGFEPALLELVEPWLAPGARTPTVACGMVGARQGWVEAPYAAVPCPPADAASAVAAPARDPRLDCRVLAGLSQAHPPDVMRGEETQLAGLLAAEPGLEATVCLPGTHTKWVRVAGGEVRAFRTCLTGELFSLLGTASTLRHSVAPDDDAGTTDPGAADAAFADALPGALDGADALAASLFGLRARALLEGEDPVRARARLSALLIGAELAATRAWWEGGDVVLVGATGLAGRYAAALTLAGGASRAVDAGALTLAGLVAARRALFPDLPSRPAPGATA